MKQKFEKLCAMINPLRDIPDRNVLAVLVSIPVVLTLLEFWGQPRNLYLFVPDIETRYGPGTARLLAYIYWSLSCLICYVAFPLMVLRHIVGKSPMECGLRLKGITTHLWIYVTLFFAFFPLLVMVSFRKSFQAVYPFYFPGPGEWPLFLIFEFFYLLQFFSLEFFFRGYILFTMEKPLGYYAVLIMSIPYCMIHYHKPFPEAMAAIIAGIILGTLALRTRSIWYGVLIHVSVALSMDILSLLQKGLLIRLFVP